MDTRSRLVIDSNDEDNNVNSTFNGNNTSVSCTSQTLDDHHRKQTNSVPASLSGLNVVRAVRYRECLKNHAASIGGSVRDGCGEFMPGGEEGTLEALRCAACDCHRNFHRKEPDGGGSNHRMYNSVAFRPPSSATAAMNLMMNPLMLPPPPNYHQMKSGTMSPSSGVATPMNVAYGRGGGAESSSEDLNVYGQWSGEYGGLGERESPFSLSHTKKRFRTKFTAEQKERMTEFAEKLGWRMNKTDEEELVRFCAEIGVKRQVFKVWMHNNKNNINKQP